MTKFRLFSLLLFLFAAIAGPAVEMKCERKRPTDGPAINLEGLNSAGHHVFGES
jgi:hypothetical protein